MLKLGGPYWHEKYARQERNQPRNKESCFMYNPHLEIYAHATGIRKFSNYLPGAEALLCFLD
jgi:hypothetical protein